MDDNKQIARGASTNDTRSSLVKVVVKESNDKWKSPPENAVFLIGDDADFPTIKFELDLDEEKKCDWTWEITWAAATSGLRESKKRGRVLKQWSEKGTHEQAPPVWQANLNSLCLGGCLTVRVQVEKETFKRSVRVLGQNPSKQKIKEYIATFGDVPGFERIVATESRFKQFINADGEPVVAFDGGYGLTQLTNPPPKFQQAWNWKENIKAGIELYRQKRSAAKAYLAGTNKDLAYTEEQLQLETWCMWNSGHYHKWDEANKKWARDPSILTDSQTANIGWDITKDENKGKTEKELHDRDKNEYSKPHTASSLWRYTGVVYADHIKNSD